MKKIVIVLTVLAMAGSAWADEINVPPGGTGLWRFQEALPDGTATMAATFGSDMVNSNPPGNGVAYLGPWTDIGVPSWHTMFSDGGVAQIRSNDELACYHGISPNGGGGWVNQYTIMLDYAQTSLAGESSGTYYNSLLQTNVANSNDGDLFIKGTSYSDSVIGVGATGYSTSTFDSSKWHRYVISVDNSSFFRVYIDGDLYLDAPGQGVDGRFSLDPAVLLFADDSWEDAWGLVGTVATWGRALSSTEVAGMGGWIGGASTPTPLIVPEPATWTLLALAGIAFFLGRKWLRK